MKKVRCKKAEAQKNNPIGINRVVLEWYHR